jgi:hypothetical protein
VLGLGANDRGREADSEEVERGGLANEKETGMKEGLHERVNLYMSISSPERARHVPRLILTELMLRSSRLGLMVRQGRNTLTLDFDLGPVNVTDEA